MQCRIELNHKFENLRVVLLDHLNGYKLLTEVPIVLLRVLDHSQKLLVLLHDLFEDTFVELNVYFLKGQVQQMYNFLDLYGSDASS